MEIQIKDALIALLAGIKAADGQVIADQMVRLDEFLERGRPGLHPQLVHFLENRSYAKALDVSRGRNGHSGGCVRRAGKK